MNIASDDNEKELKRLYRWMWFLVLSVVGLVWAMRPLFMASANDSLLFSKGDVVDAPSLAKKLLEAPDPLSAFLADQLDPAAKTRLAVLQNVKTNLPELEAVLLEQLNAIVRGPAIYDANRFRDVPLSRHTKELLKKNPGGQELVLLNCSLLEDAYWKELIRKLPLRELVATGIVLCYLFTGIVWIYVEVKKHGITRQEYHSYSIRQPLTIIAGITFGILSIVRFLESLMN